MITQQEYLEMKEKVRKYEESQRRKEMKKILTKRPSIETLDMSTRLYNILKKRMGINTIDELLTYKRMSDFWRMRDFGKRTWSELEQLYISNGWEVPQNI